MLSKLFGEGENKSTFPLFLERAWEVLFPHVASWYFMSSGYPWSLRTSTLSASDFGCGCDGWCLANSDSPSTAGVPPQTHVHPVFLQAQPGRAVELVPLPPPQGAVLNQAESTLWLPVFQIYNPGR